MNNPIGWIIVGGGAGVLIAVVAVVIVRDMGTRQLRSWAQQDGLRLTARKDLLAHYRARYPWYR